MISNENIEKMIIKRAIQDNIESNLFKQKVIIIYGARRVGKTTLIKEIQKKFTTISLYLNCDEPDIREALMDKTSTELKSFIGNKKLVIIDEAQRVRNIGLTLKLLVDNYPDIQIIATGSSSFELSNQIIEPLTGRKYEYFLYPFSAIEMKKIYSTLEIDRLIEKRIIFGMYPEIVLNESDNERNLKEIARSYLYEDALQYQSIRNPEVLEKLLQALALQIGNEVSYNELSNFVGIDKKTVQKCISILEKAFVIFRLNPFSRNLRNELKKLRKIYFFDTGIRNALINNLNLLSLRNDAGVLWENFLVAERLKNNSNNFASKNIYFWRTHQKEEIDYIEEEAGKINAFE
ncbi:MAG: ATP-binding protein, partial [Actinobacteria bacterium]|nr:ATP-binding protein [Actinomycetota bacterium]